MSARASPASTRAVAAAVACAIALSVLPLLARLLQTSRCSKSSKETSLTASPPLPAWRRRLRAASQGIRNLINAIISPHPTAGTGTGKRHLLAPGNTHSKGLESLTHNKSTANRGIARRILDALGITMGKGQQTLTHSKGTFDSKGIFDRGIGSGILDAIGNTPLIRIRSLSEATGCSILAKAEFLNPGGSVKDRVALQIVNEALSSGALSRGGLITEGSAGSTGISLSLVAAASGCRCFVAMPSDAAEEKAQAMRAYGTEVCRVPPVSITHPDHFVHVAQRRARQETGPALFADQFENLANFRAHYEGTGREIWEQTGGRVDAFICAAGTGGTIAGVSCFLKDQDARVRCYIVDPPGSGLYNRVTRGVMYAREEAEGKRAKNPQDTITEGIGINRLTANFLRARLDGAFRGTDREAVDMSRSLLAKDGLFVGSSSAMNCVGAVKLAKALGPGHTIVTILCDSGQRYLSNFFNKGYVQMWLAQGNR